MFSRRRARKARQGRPVPEEFLVRLNDESISVDRMDHVERKDMAAIATERGKGREDGGKVFQGWAILTVDDAGAEGRSVKESPIDSNPFHADIWLNLPDKGDRRDMQKKHSVDLAARASWEDPP